MLVDSHFLSSISSRSDHAGRREPSLGSEASYSTLAGSDCETRNKFHIGDDGRFGICCSGGFACVQDTFQRPTRISSRRSNALRRIARNSRPSTFAAGVAWCMDVCGLPNDLYRSPRLEESEAGAFRFLRGSRGRAEAVGAGGAAVPTGARPVARPATVLAQVRRSQLEHRLRAPL